MNVTCPECRSVFRVDPAKLPGTNIRARCSVCGGVIGIAAGADSRTEFAAVTSGGGYAAKGLADYDAVAPWRASGSTPATPAPRVSAPVGRGPTPSAARAAVLEEAVPAAPPTISTHEASSSPPEVVSPGWATPGDVTPTSPAPTVAEDRDSNAAGALPPPGALPAETFPSTAARPTTPGRPVGASSTPAASAPVSRPSASPRPVMPGMPAPFARPSTHTGGGGAAPSVPAPFARPSFMAPPSAPSQRPSALQPPAAATAAPGRPSPAPAESRDPSATTSAPTPRSPINPFLANDPNAKAKRLARALVSDIVVYFPQKRDEGVRDGTLKQLFREEIKKSYEEYVDQIGREFAESTTHFQDALNDVLAGGKKLF